MEENEIVESETETETEAEAETETAVGEEPSSSDTMKERHQRRRQYIPIIEVVDAYKHYGIYNHWHLVLRKFNMTVYSGEIYTLLGPHGCGKSTVLNVVTGIKSLNQGEVQIFGFRPGHELSGIPGIRVGYIPQIYGLYEDFTINEILRYYAALLHLKHSYSDERIGFLSNLLALPSEKIRVKYCTEGIKCQISFAIALLHEPELLVLDEPTAGVDPVLKKSIWKHLLKLAREEERTILVTTQNCLEARQADRIGIMRSGHILLEGNPDELLTNYKEKHLELLYMKIYELRIGNQLLPKHSIQENPIIKLEPLNRTASEGFIYEGEDAVPPVLSPRKTKSLNYKLPFTCENNFRWLWPNCRRLGILIMRDICRCFRQYIWLSLMLLMPALFVLIFGYTIGGRPQDLSLAIVNKDAVKGCKKNYELYTSCQILGLINPRVIRQVSYKTLEEGINSVKKLDTFGVLEIGANFSSDMKKHMLATMYGRQNVHTVGHKLGPMKMYLDVTSKIISAAIEKEIEQAVVSYLFQATKSSVSEKFTTFPIASEKPIYGNIDDSETDYILPGLSVVMVYHLSAFVSISVLVSDRMHYICQRDYLAGVKLIETILSMMLTYGFVILLQVCLTYVVILLIFETSSQATVFYFIPILIMQIWTGLCFGVVVSMLSRRVVYAGMCEFCFLILSILLCGIIWPVNGLPVWLQKVVKYFPQTNAAAALRSVVQRNISITHPEVYMALVTPLVWLIIFIIMCNIINRISY